MNRGKTKEYPRIGVATLVIKNGRILIGYDGEKKQYSFPGGVWEGETNQESLEQGAAREIFEETGGTQNIEGQGVRCKNFKKLYDHTFFRDDLGSWWQSIGFVADYESGEPADDPIEKHSQWRFVEPAEASKLDLFEPARKGLSIFLNTIK